MGCPLKKRRVLRDSRRLSDQPEMVEIPAGKFKIGRGDGPELEKPAHWVNFPGFYIGRKEVTNAEYAEFVIKANYKSPEGWPDGKPPAGRESWPVQNVSFDDAQAFAEWQSSVDNVTYRLPTEGEWEYAARGGTDDNLYPWGKQWIDGCANVDTDSPKPVGQYTACASRWELSDVVGNVWEWTSSEASFYPDPDPTVIKYIPPQERVWMIIRGGSYQMPGLKPMWRKEYPSSTIHPPLTWRQWHKRTTTHPTIGFRLVRVDGQRDKQVSPRSEVEPILALTSDFGPRTRKDSYMRSFWRDARRAETGRARVRQPVVRIGRDAAQCHIVFDQTSWPTVRATTASFVWQRDDACWRIPIRASAHFSTIGIIEPAEVWSGALVQFGEGGPVLRILHVEGETPPSQVSAQAQHSSTPPADQSAALEFESEGSGQLERIYLTSETTLLGRDPTSAVPVDAAAAIVSRRHAEIQQRNNQFMLVDLHSFNGTLLNDQRVTQASVLYDDDRIQLGMGGPVLRFRDASRPSPVKSFDVTRRTASEATLSPAASVLQPAALAAPEGVTSLQSTMVAGLGGRPSRQQTPAPISAYAEPFIRRAVDGKPQISIGRAPDNDIRLDGLQISGRHARFIIENDGILIEDTGSTNGVYLGGARIRERRFVRSGDVVQIGPFALHADRERGVSVFDMRSKTRIDVLNITKVSSDRSGRGPVKLLDDVSLTIRPNEFIGLLGPSGAGKSTLMDALNGMRPATSGQVFVNDLDLYRHLDLLKQSIGYVPQDDIIHRELTIYNTLLYVARLRLSRDVSNEETNQIIGEVLDVTGLAERRDVPVAQLPGAQRKRASIAVELITKPSISFLDEPTSGLDPATEEKIMKLFRQIAESGRTVILTTHAMENVRLFDKIAVLMRGRLVFYGTPEEALVHVGAESFKDLYDKLEAPIEVELGRLSSPSQDAAATKQKRI